jgi:hypothetical protein
MKRHLIQGFALMLLAALAMPLPAQAQDGKSEGIKVHGRWTIDVRNPDGSLASHHEFDNALISGGARALAGLLGKFYKEVLTWKIWLESPANGLCDPGTVVCEITERLGAGSPGLGELSVHVPTGFLFGEFPLGTVELKGAVNVTGGGSIRSVASVLALCRSSACVPTAPDGTQVFSRHTLAEQITVEPNQVVQITVVFSFS